MATTQQWFYENDGKAVGPIDNRKLRQMARDGVIEPSSRIRSGANGNWYEAKRIKGLFSDNTTSGNGSSAKAEPKVAPAPKARPAIRKPKPAVREPKPAPVAAQESVVTISGDATPLDIGSVSRRRGSGTSEYTKVWVVCGVLCLLFIPAIIFVVVSEWKPEERTTTRNNSQRDRDSDYDNSPAEKPKNNKRTIDTDKFESLVRASKAVESMLTGKIDKDILKQRVYDFHTEVSMAATRANSENERELVAIFKLAGETYNDLLTFIRYYEGAHLARAELEATHFEYAKQQAKHGELFEAAGGTRRMKVMAEKLAMIDRNYLPLTAEELNDSHLAKKYGYETTEAGGEQWVPADIAQKAEAKAIALSRTACDLVYNPDKIAAELEAIRSE